MILYDFVQPNGALLTSNPSTLSSIIFSSDNAVDGEARLLDKKDNNNITIAKLGNGSIIGLASLLSRSPCEKISASKETII